MNKRFLTLLFLLLSSMIILWSCNKKQEENSCLSYMKAPVTKIDGASSGLINQEIILTVSFTCFNGCGQFGSLDEAIVGNVTNITVNAKYEGCICTQDIPTRQAIYKFKKSQPGTYNIKFWQTENTFLTHTVVIQ